MKRILSFCAVALALLAVSSEQSFAQTYAVSNPIYFPTATVPAKSLTAAGDVDMVLQGISAVTVQVKGTNGGFAATIRGSTDPLSVADASATWTTLQAVPVAGGAMVTSQAANGNWAVNAAGLTRVQFHLTSIVSGTATVVMAGQQSVSGVTALNQTDASAVHVVQSIAVGDPCQNPAIAKSSVAIAQSSSATTKIVDTSGSKVVYACSFVASFNGTNPTGTFKTGTHASADCDTGTASLTGAIAPSATIAAVTLSGPGTIMQSTAGGQLCLTTAATTSVQGVLTYVQQ